MYISSALQKEATVIWKVADSGAGILTHHLQRYASLLPWSKMDGDIKCMQYLAKTIIWHRNEDLCCFSFSILLRRKDLNVQVGRF